MSKPRICQTCKGKSPSCLWCKGTGFDIDHTDLPVCPYCGHEEQDISEIDRTTTRTCGNCEKDYGVEPDFSVSFTTWQLKAVGGEQT